LEIFRDWAFLPLVAQNAKALCSATVGVGMLVSIGGVWGLAYHQWEIYLFLNLLRLILNCGTYAGLVAGVPLCAAQPVFAVASVLLPRW
jgi:hypothetical protein